MGQLAEQVKEQVPLFIWTMIALLIGGREEKGVAREKIGTSFLHVRTLSKNAIPRNSNECCFMQKAGWSPGRKNADGRDENGLETSS